MSADLQALRHGAAQFALAPGMRFGKRLEVGDDGRAVDQFGGARGRVGYQASCKSWGRVTEPEWGEAESDNQMPGPRL